MVSAVLWIQLFQIDDWQGWESVDQLEGLRKAEGKKKRKRLKVMTFPAALCGASKLFYFLWTLGDGPGTKPAADFWYLTLGS